MITKRGKGGGSKIWEKSDYIICEGFLRSFDGPVNKNDGIREEVKNIASVRETDR